MDYKEIEIQNEILKDFNECLGKRLTIFREARNFSKKDFANKLGISVEKLEIYESGKEGIPFSLLFLSAEILNISLSCFFGKSSEIHDRKTKTNLLKTLFALKKEVGNM